MTDTEAGDAAFPFKPIESEEEWLAQGWATEPESVTAAPRLGIVVSIRFDPDEAMLVRRAAKLAGKTRTAFVRDATIAAAAGTAAQAMPAAAENGTAEDTSAAGESEPAAGTRVPASTRR